MAEIRVLNFSVLFLVFLVSVKGTDAGMKSWLDMNQRCEGLCFYFSGSQGYNIDDPTSPPKSQSTKYHDKYAAEVNKGDPNAKASANQCDGDEILPITPDKRCDPMILGLQPKFPGKSDTVSSILKAYDPEQSVYIMDHFLYTGDPTTDFCKNYVYGYDYIRKRYPDKVYVDGCRIIVSVQQYTPPNCDLYDRQVLNDKLCAEAENNTLYRITMASRFDDYSCDFARNGNRPCNPREFIAISFPSIVKHDVDVPNEFVDPSEREQNPWFTCILGEDHVTTWYGKSYEQLKIDELATQPITYGMQYMFEYGQSRQRLTLTEPYSSGSVGIFWSTVRKVEKENTILCSFIITDRAVKYHPVIYDPSGNKVTYQADKPKYFNFGSFGKDNNGWHIRLAEGLVQRGEDYKRDYLPAYRSQFSEEEIHAKISGIHDQAITGINFYRFVIVTDKPVLTKKSILAATPVRGKKKETAIPGNAQNLLEMDAVYRSCRESKSKCYFIGEETGCITKEKCHLLVSIKADQDWTKLYIDYIYHARVIPGEIRRLKPFGWAGIGFSEDHIMGGELSFVCGFTGTYSSNITVNLNTINPRSNLYFPNANYQHHIRSKYVKYGQLKGENEPRVHCSFYIEMKDFISTDLGDYRAGAKYQLDLQNSQYTLLLAFGTGRNHQGEVPYHGKSSRKYGPNHEFSKKHYLESVIA